MSADRPTQTDRANQEGRARDENPLKDAFADAPEDDVRSAVRRGRLWGPVNSALGWIAAVTAVPIGAFLLAEGFVSLTWRATPAEITSSRVNNTTTKSFSVRPKMGRDGERTTYRFRVRYRYSVGNETFTGNRLWHRLGPSTVNPETIAAIAEPYPAGADATAYYSWLRPGLATLERGPTRWDFLIFVGGLTFAVVGIKGGRHFRASAAEAEFELEAREILDELGLDADAQPVNGGGGPR